VQPNDRTEVHLPRFRIETDVVALTAPLIQLGMGPAFSGGADFSGMSAPGGASLQISDVFHRVFVELNEEGTEAAAATGIVMMETAAMVQPAPPPVFDASHPFLFFLREPSTGAILFAGRVIDPA